MRVSIHFVKRIENGDQEGRNGGTDSTGVIGAEADSDMSCRVYVELSKPNPDIITLRIEMRNTVIRIRSLRMVAERQSLGLLMFNPPMTRKRMPTRIWNPNERGNFRIRNKAEMSLETNLMKE